MGKSFKDYEHEGWTKKASHYERVALPITRQGFEPILTSFGDLRGKRFLDVCTGPGHLAGEAATRGAAVDAVDFSEAMVREAKARFSGISFTEGDAEALPYNDASFGTVRTSLIIQFQKPEVREQIMEELVKALVCRSL